MSTPRILVNKLSFHLENTPVVFNDISLSFETMKYSIVGDNGVGKTTFLKLLAGKLLPEKGSVQCNGTLLSIPQTHTEIPQSATIQDILGVSAIKKSIAQINQGNGTEHDFEVVADHWNIESDIHTALQYFNLHTINLNTLFSALSGGQKTKIFLAKTKIFATDFILFDEPTNNLDKDTREILYHYIDTHHKGIIVVSHDRTLLNKMDHIIEITTKGIKLYGGNYELYCNQKKVELAALEQDYDEAQRAIKQAKHNIQSTREKHEKLAGRGRKAFRRGDVDKLTAKSKKGRSEKSKSKMATLEDKIISEKQQTLSEIKEKIEVTQSLHASLDATRVPNNKVVLEIKNLDFKYPDQSDDLIKDFNLQIIGPERIAITGPNGSGKSTLVKLIRNLLSPKNGTIIIGVEHIAYLDQNVGFLDVNLSILDNFLTLNPKQNTFDAYSALAEFQFKNKNAEKKVSDLSGGEKIRAGLAISLMSKHPPQLIILDEPTNHLDLRSIEAIENMLSLYQGAILAISHDEPFLKHIAITRSVTLCRYL